MLLLFPNDGLIDCFCTPPLWHCSTMCFIGHKRIYYEDLHLGNACCGVGSLVKSELECWLVAVEDSQE